MASLSAIRAGLAANLAGLAEQVSPYMLANPSPPTLQVMGPENIDYLVTMDRSASRWTVIVQGFVPGEIGDVPAQELLDAWLSDAGAYSVRLALESDTTLGGACEDVTVVASRGYMVYVLEGRGATLGCEWVVDIVA